MKPVYIAIIILIFLFGCPQPPDPPINGNNGGNGNGLIVIPKPIVEIFEIPGGACPIIEDVPLGQDNFTLPDECELVEEGDPAFSEREYSVNCDSNILVDHGCIESGSEDDIFNGSTMLVQTPITNKTLIECQVAGFYAEENDFIRAFDWHPGPQFLSFYLGYDDSTGEITELRNWDLLFSYLAPFETEEQVLTAIRLASSDEMYCQFSSKGFPPEPEEGYTYENNTYEYEEFLVAKESIKLSSIETMEGGFKVHLLMESQGCPCFLDYYEMDFSLTALTGEITEPAKRYVYSAVEGCIC